MKKNLAGLELKYVVQELQELVGAKVVKIYQPLKKEIYIQFHSSKTGKQLLRIMVPHFIYLTQYRLPSPQSPYGFCQALRKYLNQTRIKTIEQQGLERIIEFVFQTKAGVCRLIVELFSKGNIVLCKEDYTIISAMEVQKWKDRQIKRNEVYKYPKAVDLIDFKIEDLQNLLEKTTKDSIVTFLAIDVGLGGMYAEEVCGRSQVNKNNSGLNKREIERVYGNIVELLSRKYKPYLVYGDDKVIDIVPFELVAYEKRRKKFFASFNEALDTALTPEVMKHEEVTEVDIRREKLKKILQIQTENVKDMEKEIKENQRRGELIYERYQEVKGLLDKINDDMKRLSNEELKKKYPGINLKLKKVVVSI